MAAVAAEANNAKQMRLKRMNQIPDLCVMTRLIRADCVQNLLHRGNHKSSHGIKHLTWGQVPHREQKFTYFAHLRRLKAAESVSVSFYTERAGAKVAN
jgi:hypothetical protein